MDQSPLTKIDKVRDALRDRSVLVAFSGGVDSSTLALIAKDVASRVVLLTVNTATIGEGELEVAKRVASELELEHHVIWYDWLAESELANNSRDRCYQCKKKLASVWIEEAEKRGFEMVVEGTTASDIAGHRPGLRALEETGVHSPLLNAGLLKEEIRAFASEMDLSVSDSASMACLATRFPYDMKITSEMLEMVTTLENFARIHFGVRSVRARYHGNLVRIEVGRDERSKLFDEEKLDRFHQFANEVGFTFVTLDAYGYRTGAMDEV
ncbi:MAG: ATP-dependent sacrificial sulfur transferase LarE [Candidatus Thorarchaeota archaeon]